MALLDMQNWNLGYFLNILPWTSLVPKTPHFWLLPEKRSRHLRPPKQRFFLPTETAVAFSRDFRAETNVATAVIQARGQVESNRKFHGKLKLCRLETKKKYGRFFLGVGPTHILKRNVKMFFWTIHRGLGIPPKCWWLYLRKSLQNDVKIQVYKA